MISKKKQEGVTLISLVITIIILIILASISIKVLLGEDGLITKAKEAKKAQKISEIKERISLEITSAKAEAILRNEELEKAQVKDIIEPKYGTLKEDEDTIVTKEGNYEISLQEIYYGALSESGSYSAKVEQVEMLEQELENLREQYKTLEEANYEILGTANNNNSSGGSISVTTTKDYKAVIVCGAVTSNDSNCSISASSNFVTKINGVGDNSNSRFYYGIAENVKKGTTLSINGQWGFRAVMIGIL